MSVFIKLKFLFKVYIIFLLKKKIVESKDDVISEPKYLLLYLGVIWAGLGGMSLYVEPWIIYIFKKYIKLYIVYILNYNYSLINIIRRWGYNN